MGKRKREQRPPKDDEADAGLDALDDWDNDDEDRVRMRPQRPKDEVTPRKKERRRRREVMDF